MHAAAGTLDRKSFGEPFVPKLTNEELQGIYDISKKPEMKWPVTPDQNRRAIYILNRRSFRFPFFDAFDPANSGASCPVRQTTTVPAQALTLMNNSIVAAQSKAMAERLIKDGGKDLKTCIKKAWLLAYSREANNAELESAEKFIAQSESENKQKSSDETHLLALTEFCLALINTTEFIYTN